MPRELQLSDLWGVVIALGAFVALLNIRTIWGWRSVIMSRLWKASGANSAAPLIHVPVAPTGASGSITFSATPSTIGTEADTDAVDDGTDVPRISRRLSDPEIVTVLAVQRGKDGKYRFSANQITVLVGGSRADVLAQVRAIRDTTQYRPVTPEQTAVREQLGLSSRQNA